MDVGVMTEAVKGGTNPPLDPGGGGDRWQCCDAARALVLLRASCWSAPMWVVLVRSYRSAL